jgi:hypothetical protein
MDSYTLMTSFDPTVGNPCAFNSPFTYLNFQDAKKDDRTVFRDVWHRSLIVFDLFEPDVH